MRTKAEHTLERERPETSGYEPFERERERESLLVARSVGYSPLLLTLKKVSPLLETFHSRLLARWAALFAGIGLTSPSIHPPQVSRHFPAVGS